MITEISTDTTPTVSETRDAQTARLNTSRPNPSVPITCSGLGAR